jgi:hypothetical protein
MRPSSWLILGLLVPAATPAAAESEMDAPTDAPAETSGAPSSELRDLLAEEVSTSAGGSFGSRLRRYGVTPYTHGQIAVEAEWESEPGEPTTAMFALRDFHLYFGADIQNRIVPELFLDLEPITSGAHTTVGVGVRYAQVDIKAIDELLVLRAGLFLLPFGTFNSKNYPRFVTRLNDAPPFAEGVVPEDWREVGLQLHGSWNYAPERSFTYAVYVTNGIEQVDADDPADPSDDGVDEGGEPQSLQTVFEDTNFEKSVGVRLSIEPIIGLTLGASTYTGVYTADGRRQFSAAGVDAELHLGDLNVEAEGMLSVQEVAGRDLLRHGFYALAGYRVHPLFEPFVAVDYLGLRSAADDDAQGYRAGFVLHPFPSEIPTALLKSVYRVELDRQGDFIEQEVELQLAIGF